MTVAPDIDSLRAAQAALQTRPLQAVIDPLIGVCQRLCDPADPARLQLIAVLHETTGLSVPVIVAGLDTTVGAWIGQTGDEAAAIRGLLQEEFRNPAALSGWVPTARPGEEERWVPAGITLQILAGNVFAATLHQVFAGLLARTAQLLKPAQGQEAVLQQLLLTIGQVDPALSATLQLVQWDTPDSPIATACYQAAKVITITGSDATLAAVRQRCAALELTPQIHGFGHRVSGAYIARYCWETPDFRDTVYAALARDTCAYDQAGCLSPQIVFIEDILPTAIPREAERIFAALQEQTVQWPVGERMPASLAARRSWLDRRHLLGSGAVFADDAVVVAVDASATPLLGPGMRTLIVAPVGFPQGVAERLQPYAGQLGTLGVALHPAVPLKGWKQASRLFPKPVGDAENGIGFNRICPLGTMQTPGIAEPHDGRPRVRLFLSRETRQSAE